MISDPDPLQIFGRAAMDDGVLPFCGRRHGRKVLDGSLGKGHRCARLDEIKA
jgi:hypothetical protein